MSSDNWGRQYPAEKQAEYRSLEGRTLMRDGKWLVSPEEAVRVAKQREGIKPPPDEDRRAWELRKPPISSSGGVSYLTGSERRW